MKYINKILKDGRGTEELHKLTVVIVLGAANLVQVVYSTAKAAHLPPSYSEVL